MMKSSTEKKIKKTNGIDPKKHSENLLGLVIFIILLVVVPIVILMQGHCCHWTFLE